MANKEGGEQINAFCSTYFSILICYVVPDCGEFPPAEVKYLHTIKNGFIKTTDYYTNDLVNLCSPLLSRSRHFTVIVHLVPDALPRTVSRCVQPFEKCAVCQVGSNWSQSNLLNLLLTPQMPQDKMQYKKPYKHLRSIACECTGYKSERAVAVLSHDCSPDVPLRTHTSL